MGKSDEMSKITLNYDRDGRDYVRIMAAVGRILARQRFVSPIEVFVEMGLFMSAPQTGQDP